MEAICIALGVTTVVLVVTNGISLLVIRKSREKYKILEKENFSYNNNSKPNSFLLNQSGELNMVELDSSSEKDFKTKKKIELEKKTHLENETPEKQETRARSSTFSDISNRPTMLDMLNSSDDEKWKRECENLKLKLNELEKEKDQEMIFLKEENSGLKNEKSKLYDDMNKRIFDFEIEKENLLKWKNENVRLFEEMNKRTNEIENEKEFYKKQIEMQHQNNSFMDQSLKEKNKSIV